MCGCPCVLVRAMEAEARRTQFRTQKRKAFPKGAARGRRLVGEGRGRAVQSDVCATGRGSVRPAEGSGRPLRLPVPAECRDAGARGGGRSARVWG